MKQAKEFRDFLLKRDVLSLAIGVVIGGAVSKLVAAIVADLVMPIVGVVTPAGDWRKFTAGVGKLQFGVGDLAGVTLDFLVISAVVFFVIQRLVRPQPAAPDPG